MGFILKTQGDFGRLIRRARKEQAWSQTELAKRLGCTQKWISMVENGQANPRLEAILVALRVLRVDVRADIREPATVNPSVIDLIASGKKPE